MPEGNANVEIAAHLREHGSGRPDGQGDHRRQELLEIFEAVLLAVVALATALSGYQAAKWDGVSARQYATSSRLRVQSEQASLTSNQYLLYNSGTLDAWLQAQASGDKRLAAVLARRFTPNYEVAFVAWLGTHPVTNASAPAGPRFMPQYRDPYAAQATTLAAQASAEYTRGVDSRDTGEDYVRLTVILAAVLFLIAVGQRFKIRNVRWSVLGVACAFLIYARVLVAIYPRA
jgi:hypothetical protein